MILVVGALRRELASLGPPTPAGEPTRRGDLWLLRTRPGEAAAREAAEAIASLRPRAVLHVGLAGGLRSGLGMGDLVVVTAASRSVLKVDEGGPLPPTVPTHGGDALRAALARLPDRMAQGAILTVDRFVPDRATKEAIGRAGPYLACEMEAAPLVEAAAALGAPYLGLRAISDPCDTDVLGRLRPGPGGRTQGSLALAGWRTWKGARRAASALARALPVAVEVAQAMSAMSRPASGTSPRGT